MTFCHQFNHSRFFAPNAYDADSSYTADVAHYKEASAGVLSRFSVDHAISFMDFLPLDANDLHAVLNRDQLDPIALFKRRLDRAFRLFVNKHGILHKFSISKILRLSRFKRRFNKTFILGSMIFSSRPQIWTRRHL